MIRITTLALLGLFSIATPASAMMTRASRIDATLDICVVPQAQLANNGSAKVDLASYTRVGPGLSCTAADFDLSNPSPLSINFYGTRYTDVFVNENGLLTFGAANGITTTADLLNLGLPAIAPLLTDFDYTSGIGDVRYGWGQIDGGPGFFISYKYRDPNTSASTRVQVGFLNIDNATGNFNLELNYDQLVFDGGGATAGFSNGTGLGVVFTGAGVDGAYLGDQNATPCEIGANALPCNNFGVAPGSIDNGGNTILGRYAYQFRNGIPTLDGNTDIPEPATPILFGLGVMAIGLLRRHKR